MPLPSHSLHSICIVEFAEADGGTQLTLTQIYDDPDDRDMTESVGSREGWGQSFDKLDALLARG